FLRLTVVHFVLLVVNLGVGVADRIGLSQIHGRNSQHGNFAVFRRPEHGFAILEIFGQFFWSRHRNVAGLWWSQYHILDLTLFVPVLIERRHRCLRHFHITGDTLGDLPAQDRASLILDETAFSKASLAD